MNTYIQPEISVPENEIEKVINFADIFIWRFDYAPEFLRKLSINGGDEDWLVIVKKSLLENQYIPFLYSGGIDSLGGIDRFDLGEYVMLIGSHA